MHTFPRLLAAQSSPPGRSSSLSYQAIPIDTHKSCVRVRVWVCVCLRYSPNASRNDKQDVPFVQSVINTAKALIIFNLFLKSRAIKKHFVATLFADRCTHVTTTSFLKINFVSRTHHSHQSASPLSCPFHFHLIEVDTPIEISDALEAAALKCAVPTELWLLLLFLI